MIYQKTTDMVQIKKMHIRAYDEIIPLQREKRA